MPAFYDVYGLGNALVDLQVPVTAQTLSELGLPPGAMILTDEAERDRVLSHVDGRAVMVSAGGSAANSMVGVAVLGGRAAFTGCIARDAHGSAYARSLAEAGVTFRPCYGDSSSGTCLVLITPDGERTLLTTLGCAVQLRREGICLETLARSRCVYIEGYLWDVPDAIEACRFAMEEAQRREILVAFSASDSFCVDRHLEDFRDILASGADLFFANAEEARALMEMEDPIRAARAMGRQCGLAVVTDGPRGAYVATRRECWHVPAVPVDAVDTTGAGDAFAAGFLYGIVRHRGPVAAAKAGAALAAEVVSHYGARPRLKATLPRHTDSPRGGRPVPPGP